MKKCLMILTLLSLMMGLAIPAQAASDLHIIPEMELSLAIPSEYLIFTRHMDQDDPLLSDYGFSLDGLMEELVAGNIYLNAVDPDGNEEIVVTMEENIISEFNGLGETSLLMLASTLKDGYEEYGISVSSYDIYHHPQLEFIRIYFNTTDKTSYGLQYYTIYGGQAMNFTMRSYEGPISGSQERTIQNVVDSVELHFYVPTKTPVEETPAFVHTDPDTGTTFTVPANWSVQPFSKERDILDIQFSCAEDPALLIAYASNDIWSELSFFEKLFMSREKTEDILSSTAQVAEEYGVPESSVSKMTYNGETYFIVEAPYTTDLYGTSFTATVNQAIHVEDGWMYMFNFYGDASNPHFDDFEKLLKSIEYGDKGATGIGSGVVIIIAAVAIILCVIIIRKKKRQVKPAAAAMRESVQHVIPSNPDCIYCHHCGNKLPSDSSFCNACGTRLIEKE